jgi:hypothetical protein
MQTIKNSQLTTDFYLFGVLMSIRILFDLQARAGRVLDYSKEEDINSKIFEAVKLLFEHIEIMN